MNMFLLNLFKLKAYCNKCSLENISHYIFPVETAQILYFLSFRISEEVKYYYFIYKNING